MEGYDVTTVINGKDGVRVALDVMPDVIFCDLMMPEMDGFEVLEHIQSHDTTAHTPFVFVTARTEREVIQRGKAMGALDFLLKPFTASSVLQLLEKIKVL